MSDLYSNKKLTWLAATLVALVTLAIYLPALQNGFVNWDDHILVYENPTLRSIDIPFIGWALTDVSTGLWHPMLWLSFALDYTAWGLNPFGYHLTNIIFHSVNTFLVFILVTRLFLTRGYSLDKKTLIAVTVTALLFGIHPLHVESVAWVTERKDVLYSFFFLASILSYLQYASVNLKKYYLISIIFFILSLMSKPMAVSLPAVLLILDFYPLRRLTWEGGLKKNRGVLVEKLPFLLLGILFAALTVWVHPGLESQGTYPLKGRIFIAGHSYIYSLFKLAFPFNLAPIYPLISIPDFFSVEYLGPFIGLATITLFFIRLLKNNKIFSAIWFCYIAMLIPVLGQVGAQPHADRYAYLSSIGPFLLLGSVVGYLFERWLKRRCQALLITLLILVATIFGIKTIKQIALWRDSITLWSYEIKLFPDEVVAYVNRGNAYRFLGKDQEAIKDLDRAIRLNPGSVNGYRNRGSAYRRLGNYQQSIKDDTKAIELDPLEAGKENTYGNRGISYRSLGDYQAALKDFDSALKANPRNSMAYYERGVTYMTISEYRLSIKDFSEAIRFNPGFAEAFCLRGAAYVSSGSYPQAIEDFDMAVKLKPGFEEAYYNRGTTYRIIGDNYKAVNDFNVAIQLNPQNAEAYNNRGNAYRDLGNYQKAIEDYSIAIKLDPQDAIAYKNRGIAHKNLGNNGQALNDFKRAEELSHK